MTGVMVGQPRGGLLESSAMTASRRGEESHARIVRDAARLFRERGIAGTGVDAVMDAAGLTHGGFYAHFRNKESLVTESIAAAFAEARKNLFADEPTARGKVWERKAADRYLAKSHVAHPGHGCALPALAAEVARGGGKPQHVFAGEVTTILDEMAARLGGRRARERAVQLLASWVGALTLARVMEGGASDQILEAVRRPSTKRVTKRAAARKAR